MKLFLNVTVGGTNHIFPSNTSLEVEKFTIVRVKTSGDMFYHVSSCFIACLIDFTWFSSRFDPQIFLDLEVAKVTKKYPSDGKNYHNVPGKVVRLPQNRMGVSLNKF